MFRLVFLFSLLTWPLRLPFTLLGWLVWRLGRRSRTLFVSLEGQHPHRNGPRSLLNRRREGVARRRLRRALRKATRDRRVARVQLRIGALQVGWSGLHGLRTLLLEARKAGLTVDAFVAHPDHRTLFVASAAATVYLPPDAMIMATGVSAEMTFFKGALDMLGAELEVVNAGAYKSAMEPFARTWPSAANQEAMNAILDDLDGQLVTGIATGRAVDPAAVREIMDATPASTDALIAAGIVDGVSDEDDWHAEHVLPISAYAGPPRRLPSLPSRPRLAVVEVRGTIRDGAFDDPMPMGACTRAVVDALDAARQNKRIKGILLHIDSPGGSATASERMWQAVRRAAADKPVIAWMGDYAASGGYYVASAADAIVAAPGTLTGSVGVIMAKPVIGGLLARLGVNQVRFERSRHAGIFSAGRGFLDSERAALEAQIQRTYGLFLDRVCTGRERERAWIEPLAQGRVWTGAQAEASGMVDRLGTEADAVALLAERAGVHGDQLPTMETFERRPGLLQRLQPGLWTPRLQIIETLQVMEQGGPLAWCPVRVR